MKTWLRRLFPDSLSGRLSLTLITSVVLLFAANIGIVCLSGNGEILFSVRTSLSVAIAWEDCSTCRSLP